MAVAVVVRSCWALKLYVLAGVIKLARIPYAIMRILCTKGLRHSVSTVHLTSRVTYDRGLRQKLHVNR